VRLERFVIRQVTHLAANGFITFGVVYNVVAINRGSSCTFVSEVSEFVFRTPVTILFIGVKTQTRKHGYA
jgi:hypothetical protein